MAADQEAVSFDAIIKAGRQKRKNEELASQILGKNRRASAPGAGARGGAGAAKTPNASLASRIGVTKRTASVPVKPKNSQVKKRNNAQSAAPGPAHSKSASKRRPNEERLLAALNPASGQSNVNPVGMTIKGASGPFVVVGSNFAPGTTSADIQSALEPMVGPILSCWITSQHPSVTAEITFAEKSAAEIVISNFHNQRADGRVLSMRLKPAGSNNAFGKFNGSNPQYQSSFEGLREQADSERQNRRADPSYQDGRYGFSEQNNQTGRSGRHNRDNNRGKYHPKGGWNAQQDQGLYSDEMMVDVPSGPRRGRGQR